MWLVGRYDQLFVTYMLCLTIDLFSNSHISDRTDQRGHCSANAAYSMWNMRGVFHTGY